VSEEPPAATASSSDDRRVPTYRGDLQADGLGRTLMHEHLFVRDPELEWTLGDMGWDRATAIERAVTGLTDLHASGISTVVDMTVIGLGRDVRLVAQVAQRVPVHIVAATGCYTADALPLYFQHRGPDRLLGGPEPLVELFIREIDTGIAGTAVRAGIIKVRSGEAGLVGDVGRVWTAAAVAHQETGVAVSTHADPARHDGLEQQAFLERHGVSAARIIIGHAGDTSDVEHLRAIMDRGSTIGLDRFGMEHVTSDAARIETLTTLLGLGYADRMVLSQDAAFFSHVTPPDWRARHTPTWDIHHLERRILPQLRQRGVSEAELDLLLVANPRRLLARGRA
jgi:phosphotriesterase-related protein